MSDVREEVRARYAQAARSVRAGGGCGCGDEGCGCGADACRCAELGSSCCGTFGAVLYKEAEREELPDEAFRASLGCGNPTAVAELRVGETVLDLGSGGGIDVLLSAARVGPTGRAIGLDMTLEMLELARANAEAAGVTNVEFMEGMIEAIPLPDGSVDVIVSNCVINLSADKGRVFREMARVLRPGGRIGISDVVASDELTAAERASRGSFSGCIAGALSFEEYRAGLEEVGLSDIEVEPTHEVEDRMFGAIVRARKPCRHVTARL
jgi:arsenite methyltransferase